MDTPFVDTPFGPARLTCLAITLTAGVILKEEKKPSPVGERQFGRHFRRRFGRG